MAIAKQFMCLSRRLSLVSFSFVLAACAQNQISSDTSVVVNGQTESRADKAITSSNNKIDNNVSSNSGGSNKITQQDRSLDYANMNPVPIMFDKLSIKLDEDGKQIVTAIGERAKMASKIIITGYCDRNQVGNAKDAAKGFPANLNVVVALALAGLGPDKTFLEIWADPTVVHNTHTIFVESDSAKFTMTMQNIPSENPRTGRITSLSVVAMLRKMTSHFSIGT